MIKLRKLIVTIMLIIVFVCICNELLDSKSYCPECNNKLITNIDTGNYYCTQCDCTYTGREVVRTENSINAK